MDDTRAFVLELIEQHWCGPNPEMDPSAGGRLLVRINGATVPRGEEDDVSISRSALALSRTLGRDHVAEGPVAPRLVFHDCGFATTLEVSCGWGRTGGCGMTATPCTSTASSGSMDRR